MKLLLDTHVFLWYITADPRLPGTFRAAIQESSNDVYLSAASVFGGLPVGIDFCDDHIF